MNIIEKYYHIQKQKGYSYAYSTLLIPQKGIKHIKNLMFGFPDVITGFGFYQLPLLASYSRSGTNWTRYITETLSGLATPGPRRKVHSDKYILDRAHKAFEVMEKYPGIILVLRDYRECLIRHNLEYWQGLENQDVISFLETEEIDQPANWYIKNIEAFEKYPGKKLCLYYEDLMQNPAPGVRAISEFLGLDKQKTEEFIDNVEEHQKASVNAYTKYGKTRSFTGKSKSLDHHSKSNLTPEQILEFDEYYFTNYPELANKYLTRYDKRKLEQAQ